MATRDWYTGPVVSVTEWVNDDHFTVSGDLRGQIVSGANCDNYDAEDKIKSVLRDVPDLLAEIDFDPESCEFFAYTKTLTVAQILVGVILGLKEYLDDPLDSVVH